ncbi:hypothetical protein C8Q77DRAFT_1065096 [Trametes polyzona]|nr:hypothetical protein C8Q77DRAFT_1065096 [Trametes polyzona]
MSDIVIFSPCHTRSKFIALDSFVSAQRSIACRCSYITHADEVLLVINYLAIAGSVYSVWGRDWRLALPRMILTHLCIIAEVSTSVAWSWRRRNLWEWCMPLVSVACKVLTMVASAILVVTTWMKTFGIVGNPLKRSIAHAPLASLLLHDDQCDIASTCVALLRPSASVAGSLFSWEWPLTMHLRRVFVIAHYRFMLSLRGLYFADTGGNGDNTSTVHLSDVRFAGISSTLLGNLGATLELPAEKDVRARNGAHREHGAAETEIEDEVPEFYNDPFRAGLLDFEHTRERSVLLGA